MLGWKSNLSRGYIYLNSFKSKPIFNRNTLTKFLDYSPEKIKKNQDIPISSLVC